MSDAEENRETFVCKVLGQPEVAMILRSQGLCSLHTVCPTLIRVGPNTADSALGNLSQGSQ